MYVKSYVSHCLMYATGTQLQSLNKSLAMNDVSSANTSMHNYAIAKTETLLVAVMAASIVNMFKQIKNFNLANLNAFNCVASSAKG